ncbi:MAG TPA: type II secretion system F family protein, partial [Armatimonadota bacterium]|nr:type II secretion system F family protein [Armatimonadota bacterium]
MPLYRYEALDRTGNKVVGAMQVADEHALASRLQTMGYQPLLVETSRRPLQHAPQAATVGVGSPHVTQSAPLAVSPLTASERSIARMLHQLHISFRAGMPAYQAVTTVAGQVHERPLRQALSEIALGIQQGHTLSGLMERYPRLFTRGDLGMMRAAERGGFLPEALGALAQQHEQDDNTRRRLRIWVWFFHSNVVLLFLVIALAFFFRPAMATMHAWVGLRAAGQAFLTISLPGLALYFCGLACLERIRRSPKWAYRWHRFLLRLPAVGKINFLRGNAVFTRILQYLYNTGTPAPTAWETAAAAVPNLYLA